jgi:hypothetical protein
MLFWNVRSFTPASSAGLIVLLPSVTWIAARPLAGKVE